MSVKGCHRHRVMNRIARSCDPSGCVVTGLAIYANAHRIDPREWARAGFRAEMCRDAMSKPGRGRAYSGIHPDAWRAGALAIPWLAALHAPVDLEAELRGAVRRLFAARCLPTPRCA